MKLGLKTTLGAIAAVLGFLAGPEVIGTFSPAVAHAIQLAGVVLAVLGIRDATDKPGVLDLSISR